MQRRAAAAYFVFFVVLTAGALFVLSGATQPQIQLDEERLTEGETLTVGDTTYTVDSLSNGSGSLTYVNESARFTAELANNSTVAGSALSFEGNGAVYSTTLDGGADVAFNGSTYSLTIPDVEDPSNFTLVNPEDQNDTATFAEGDTFPYGSNQTTVTAVSADQVELTWSDDYRVFIANGSASSVSEFRLTQQFNVTALLTSDPAVYDDTFTRDGVTYVTYRENDSNVPLDEYLPEPTTATFEEGAEIGFQGNQTTVANVTSERALMEWFGPRTNTIDLTEGGNITAFAGDTTYVVHFPTNSSVQITSDYAAYQAELDAQDKFTERMNGFWGIAILGSLTAIILLGAAYLPSRG